MSSDPSALHGGSLALRVEALERQNTALRETLEVTLFVLSTSEDIVSDEQRRDAFRTILVAAKRDGLLRDADQALYVGAKEGNSRKLRELLLRATSQPPSA